MAETTTIKELELLNGKTVSINTRLSLGAVRKYQNEGLLDKKFVNKMLTNDTSQASISLEDLVDAVYVAYLNGGGELDFDTFSFNCPLDLELLGQIYTQMLTGGRGAKKSQFREAVQQATKK